MAHSGLCCGLYRGSIYLRDLSNPNAALLPVGNAEATINQAMTEITTPNFQSLGGNACKVEYPESVTIDLVLHCTSPENLAMAFLGEASQLTAGTVTGEEHTVRSVDELIAFENAPDKTLPIVVSEGVTTFVENKDYVITNAGIKIIAGTTIPMNTAITVDYSYGANWIVEAQTVAQKTFEFVLDGANYGEDGQRAVVLKAWRVKMAPTDSFVVIGSEMASINLSGEILRDESKATGSKFFKAEFGAQATGGY